MFERSPVKVAVIGGGNMGSAFAAGFLRENIVSPADLIVYEVNEDRRANLKTLLNCELRSAPGKELSDTVIIILAVKPQVFPDVIGDYMPFINADQLIVSIMAGCSVSYISEKLNGHTKIVRCMPNLAAQISEGVTVFFAPDAVSTDEKKLVKKLLDAAGESYAVNNEDLIDAATAVSSSGSGFVFYLFEHWMKAACELGFSEEMAQRLIAKTFSGAVKFWQEGDYTAEALRKMVTSKGGTTEAGLKVFNQRGLGESLVEGIKAAYKRAGELSQK
ncbi:MAG: pyrroline-5-carboxylate reductase [Candidatus Dadabacteria bacterium]|nr:MAG: pyrroline-5-carboxylate reductase [Candidatus Dadabacteria bacterium]